MDPYEEIRKLQEENARLMAMLKMQQHSPTVEIMKENRPFPKGKFNRNQCYETFCEAIETQEFKIEGEGESYAVYCEDGNTYYFMKGVRHGEEYLMYQVNDGLIYNIKEMGTCSPKQFRMRYGECKNLFVEFYDDGITVDTNMSEEIRRVDREIRIKKDKTYPGVLSQHCTFDKEYVYEMKENGDIKNVKQHYKAWLNVDGSKKMEYFN